LCTLDSLNDCRYAEAMHIARSLFVLGFAAIGATTGFVACADDTPVLAVLEYSGGLLPKRADIQAKMGVVKSPFANKPRAVWVLREGDTIKQVNPPPERLIQFYQVSGNDTQVLCTINVKYARGRNGWRPAFLINPQPNIVWDGQKMIPLKNDEQARAFVNIPKAPPANADGFYHSLAFGLASGPSHIDSWDVQ
jgi:hypothetical protein